MVKKVMVVDDEEDITFSVKNGLERLDTEFRVTCVNSGIECLELLKKNQIPDLIIIDIMMPEMNGWQLLNRIREQPDWKKIPLIFLTAKTDDFSKTFGKTLVKDYIEKPFDLNDLKTRIDEIIKKAKQKYPGLV
jgi:CheY-like chemotaxis protein